MFSTLGLFKGIPCPKAANCSITTCLFSHDLTPVTSQAKKRSSVKLSQLEQPDKDISPSTSDNAARASTSEQTKQAKSRDSTPQSLLNSNRTASGILKSSKTPPKPISSVRNEHPKAVEEAVRDNTRTALPSYPLSKPPDTHLEANSRTISVISPQKTEPLQPRKLANPPATLPIRFKLLLLLHEQLSRLNRLVAISSETDKKSLVFSDQELITTALDEEWHIAMTNPKVYTNVMKNRIGVLKKTSVKTWTVERNAKIQKQLEESQSSKKRKLTYVNTRVETELSYPQEIAMLPQLVTPTKGLEVYGYVTSVPLEAEIEKARAGVLAAQGWEICDRCGCRFRCFPTRQEDGTITTGGSCRHHWGRLGPQPRGSAAKPIYSCCQLEQGQLGCEEKPSHVFKVSNPQRLADLIQFESTPESDDFHQPVCFDCEMGYTSYGMELVRLTATAWPSGDPLLDVLVRPKGEVLDLNTRFSGVSIQQWTQAKLWTALELPPLSQTNNNKRLKTDAVLEAPTSIAEASTPLIVPSPQHARDLLFKLIGPSTPLIGHALENDLIAVRIVHPNVIDTVVLFPHRRGLPLKNKLKFLVRDEIQWTIQEGGSDGHDSLEDALAAGELVRHRVRIKWEVLKRDGWSFDGNKLCSPQDQA